MSWSSHLRNPSEYLSVGDDIEALVLALDRDEHKMSLGIKQLTQDPWVDIKDRYPVGSKHSGTVKNLTSYGLFLELEEGIDGLVHVSDLSWNKKIKHPSEFVKKGETLDVIVLEVDSENRRLSLGHKQLEENPWDTFETIFTLNSEHEGTVIGINDKGATVQLQYGVEAFAPSRHIKKEDNTPMKEDELLKFEVIEFSKDAKRIIISHTNLWKGAERARNEQEGKNREKARKNTSKNVKKLNQSSEKTTLGELDALTALRAQLEKAESTPAPKKAAPKKAAPKKEAPKKEAAKPAAKKEKAPKEEKSESTSAIAELKDLTGVGPAMVKRMSALGINTVEELVAITNEQATSFNEQDSKISVEQWNKWIAEAKG
jgi:small subunit ribosomal protein S1